MRLQGALLPAAWGRRRHCCLSPGTGKGRPLCAFSWFQSVSPQHSRGSRSRLHWRNVLLVLAKLDTRGSSPIRFLGDLVFSLQKRGRGRERARKMNFSCDGQQRCKALCKSWVIETLPSSPPTQKTRTRSTCRFSQILVSRGMHRSQGSALSGRDSRASC